MGEVDKGSGRRHRGARRAVGVRVARWAGVAALGWLGACGDGGATAPGPPAPSPNDPVAGAFTLATVESQPLPFAIFSETGYRLELTRSTLALQAGGQFVLAVTTVETVAGAPSTYQDTTRGTWAQTAGAIALTAADSTGTTAAWDGRQLAFAVEVESRTLGLVYRRTP